MRTTIELPDALMRQAKIEAVNRGITLRELVTKGIEKELASFGQSTSTRVKFPIFTSSEPGTLNLTNEQIRKLEEQDDLEKLDRC